ncbi:MAG: nucleotidyltransferase domain-containing protein [Paludibacteraceae bacterium]|nr:nucleotidyltransferase domain-containing protein [Paludibacteraceae bacterium]
MEKLVLLGSFARNQQTEESDIDVFVTMPAKLFGVIAVKQYLEDIIGLKVDLVRNHKRLNESLLNEIQRDGIDIFECKGFCTFDIV